MLIYTVERINSHSGSEFAVKNKNLVARRKPQNFAQVMSLLTVERHARFVRIELSGRGEETATIRDVEKRHIPQDRFSHTITLAHSPSRITSQRPRS